MVRVHVSYINAISEFLDNERTFFVAVNEDSDVVGLITVSSQQEFLFLNDLFVLEEYRKNGIATTLWESVKEHYSSNTYRQLYKGFTTNIDSKNEVSIKFAEQAGFVHSYSWDKTRLYTFLF